MINLLLGLLQEVLRQPQACRQEPDAGGLSARPQRYQKGVLCCGRLRHGCEHEVLLGWHLHVMYAAHSAL